MILVFNDNAQSFALFDLRISLFFVNANKVVELSAMRQCSRSHHKRNFAEVSILGRIIQLRFLFAFTCKFINNESSPKYSFFSIFCNKNV